MPVLTTVVGSMKPPKGHDAVSACREINERCVALLAPTCPFIEVLDIRDWALPQFEGVPPEEHPDESVRRARERLQRSDAIAWVVPGYLGGLGGAIKSFVEVTCGSPYLGHPWTSPIEGTPSIALVVGDGPASAEGAADDLTRMLGELGSPWHASTTFLADPSVEDRLGAAVNEYLQNLATLALDAAKRERMA